jgi:hypothetical protein
MSNLSILQFYLSFSFKVKELPKNGNYKNLNLLREFLNGVKNTKNGKFTINITLKERRMTNESNPNISVWRTGRP